MKLELLSMTVDGGIRARGDLANQGRVKIARRRGAS